MKKYILLFLVFTNLASANVVLPTIFSDNMVLQRNSEVEIWGWGSPKEEIVITTSWNNQEYKTVPNNEANWNLILKTPEAGGPFEITIKGYNQIILKNILIGEVWLCSGQSNMEMNAFWGIKNGEEEIKLADHPNIRFFSVPKLTSTTPQDNLPANWEICMPETMKYFSAVAYFFALHLQDDLKNVPIGLINSSWGGTPAEIWIPEATIKNNSELTASANKLSTTEYGPNLPGRAFNAMINPLTGFKIAGAIWYQGESNVGAKNYEKTLSLLINSWREKWQQDFPFYFVQIAPYQYGDDHFEGVKIQNAQRKTLQLVENTGMAMTSDISTTDDIHPKDKKSVGNRLAEIALKKHYKTRNTIAEGPLFKNIEIKKNTISITFDHAEELYFKNKKTALFEVAGADNIFHTAEAKIKNNKIEVTSKAVKEPKKVRFAWKNTAQSDVFNSANIPASAFISE
ncbi:sialate O-acetylesterase [Flavobacterium arsenatis]|uniref:Sialate O-acetylesterase n=1 Tax=Flavobacterium arsenatis TaxID=1484332 RepID=A0ABU1TJ92_9FLAO|nr:sialate O-acetylesterase [Flavobacterium arsenatis]MDR6966064.1 sialate O-acetylesterase [Flavobacterium arsenatis]